MQIKGVTSPHLCACPKPGRIFLMCRGRFVLNCLRWR